jgi:hypothetical protein
MSSRNGFETGFCQSYRIAVEHQIAASWLIDFRLNEEREREHIQIPTRTSIRTPINGVAFSSRLYIDCVDAAQVSLFLLPEGKAGP